MTRARVLFIVLLSMCLTGCVAAAAAGAAAGGYYVGKDERTAGQIARDARITSAVKTALIREDDIKALDINVDTRNNHVTLNGSVATSEQENLAVQIARNVKNVAGVTSKLKIAPVNVEERD